MEDIEDILNRKFLRRKKEIRHLCQILASSLLNDEPMLPCVFIYGPPAVGKTVVIKELLKTTGTPFTFLQCVECYSPQILFGNLLKSITESKLEKPCISVLDCLISLKLVLQNVKKHVIVMKQCEYLSDEQFLFFCNLSKMVRQVCHISVIFVTNSLHYKINFRSVPIKVYFPRYNKSDLIQLLSNEFSDVSDNVINIFVSSFYPISRDFLELKQLISLCLNCNSANVDRNLIYNDQIYLFSVIKPLLKEHSELHSAIRSNGKLNSNGDVVESQANSQLSMRYNNYIELPYFTKWLLAAAYLISLLPPKEDIRNFVKNSTKRKKKKNSLAKMEIIKRNEMIKGRSFSINRLLATFYAITNKSPAVSANFLSQISSLVDLKLLNCSLDIDLDKPQFKYNFDFEQFNVSDMLKLS